MKESNRLLIVSFGDSAQYRLSYTDPVYEDRTRKYNPLLPVETELRTYLQGLYPGQTFAYLTTPKVTEVEWAHRDRYKDYPVLDGNAVHEIKNVLHREVETRQDLRRMDLNAPFAKV